VIAELRFIAALLLAGGSHHGGKGGGGPTGAPVHLRGVTSYDPRGGEQQAFGYTAPRATDGSTATYWQTETYLTQQFGGLKDGIGLVLSAGGSVKLSSVTVDTPTPGFHARILVGGSAGGPFAIDSATKDVSNRTTFSLDGKSGSYYVVWLTLLPPQRMAEISEVRARR